jgi:OHCU decarboxylase
MLFVASKDGISHNPAEYSRIEDITSAAQLLFNTLTGTTTSVTASASSTKPTLTQLNTLGRPYFVSVCGPLFEHSPWIAQRTWPNHPFESLAALHDALCQHMHSASDEEKLALINAHPDLVGRLAREGQLTRESNTEQAAAGLNQLTRDEIELFDRYNAEYRAKFGFPFVICARENKKAAILAAFPVRLNNTCEQEIATALAEIAKIARLRLFDAVEES